MSRIRIVRGKLTEIVGKDYNIYSESSIIDNAMGEIIEKGEKKGVSYGIAKKAPLVGKYVVEMYWTYGESNTKLMNESKFFVDMNLVVKTINYKEGERVFVTIKSEDGEPIAEGVSELNLSGAVDKEGIAIFKEPLKDYTVNLIILEKVENA